jgi:hypothetical protein
MPRNSSIVKAILVALALALVGPALAHAAAPDAATERQIRANLAANPGSVRIGPNQIRLEPGLTMTLPGRDAAVAAKACNEKYFCIYEDVNFQRASLAMSACKLYRLHNYRFKDKHGRPDRWDNEASSWINHQVGGAVATLYSGPEGSGTWFRSSGPRDKNMGSKWNDNVESVRPC